MAALHKAILRRFYEQAINQGDDAAIDQIVAPDFVDHTPPAPGLPPGPAGVKAAIADLRAAFPDLHIEVEELISEFAFVYARCTMTGTHQGAYLGIPATGTRVRVTGVDIIRFEQSKMAERWGQQERLNLLRQLGAIPALAG